MTEDSSSLYERIYQMHKANNKQFNREDYDYETNHGSDYDDYDY